MYNTEVLVSTYKSQKIEWVKLSTKIGYDGIVYTHFYPEINCTLKQQFLFNGNKKDY